jgi:hypothetical protein
LAAIKVIGLSIAPVQEGKVRVHFWAITPDPVSFILLVGAGQPARCEDFYGDEQGEEEKTGKL